MERAEADEALTLTTQVRVGGDDLDDVGGVADAIEGLGGEQAHSRDSSGKAIRRKVAMQYRSVIPAT